MTQPNVTRPQTSPNTQSGYQPNLSPTHSTLNHQDWVNAFVEYLATRWANGDHSITPPAQYGIPDATDQGYASPATWLAFTQWAQNYHTGDSPQVDAMIPYVAPGPDDFQESPAQTAARIANDQWQATFGQTQTNADRLAWQQEFANAIQSYGYQVAGANNANDFAAALFGHQAGMANSANSLAGQIYNTQGSMYNTGENNRENALASAGTLAGQLQGMWDQRTQNAINLQAHPNDFIERESAVRALTAPQGTDVPAYSNVDSLQEVINRLINYQPDRTAMPTAPSPAASPPLPTYQAPPAPPVAKPFTATTHAGAGGQVEQPNRIQPVAPASPTPLPNRTVVPNVAGGDPYHQGGNTWTDDGTPGGRWTDPYGHYQSSGGGWLNPDGTPWHAALGGIGGPEAVVGDSASGQPTGHEEIARAFLGPQGQPLLDIIPHDQIGTLQHHLMHAAQGGLYGATTYDPITNESIGEGVQPLNSGAYSTQAKAPQVPGQPVSAPGQPVVEHNPYTPPAPVSAPGRYVNQSTPLANAISPNNQAPQVTLKSYPDSAYQGLPSLQYLLGRLPRGSYNTLATGAAQGAFGTLAPESGSINYRRALDIANDPVSQALIESIYASANRDYLSEVSRAKARAPFGQALNTSLVRT